MMTANDGILAVARLEDWKPLTLAVKSGSPVMSPAPHMVVRAIGSPG